MAEFDDGWDEVLRLEETAFGEGHAEGLRDAEEQGVWQRDGFKAGYMRGFALGLEISFLGTVAAAALDEVGAQADPIASSESSVSSPYASTATGESEDIIDHSHINNRQIKRLRLLAKFAKEVPYDNAPTADFDGKLKELRALYKICALPTGPFQRNATSDNPSIGW